MLQSPTATACIWKAGMCLSVLHSTYRQFAFHWQHLFISITSPPLVCGQLQCQWKRDCQCWLLVLWFFVLTSITMAASRGWDTSTQQCCGKDLCQQPSNTDRLAFAPLLRLEDLTMLSHTYYRREKPTERVDRQGHLLCLLCLLPERRRDTQV